MQCVQRLGRRACLAGGMAAGLMGGLAGLAPGPARADATALPEVRLGILQFGTVQWVAELIRRGGLDRQAGFALRTVTLANNEAGRVALMAGTADVVVLDWLFAAARTQAGTPLRFAPFSGALGGIMVRADSPVRSLSDLRGLALGVAGGPADKSWLLVQAAGRKAGLDLATAARITYGAPPLLGAELRRGGLDAVLTFWNFAAKLEAAGCREALPVADCARALGLPGRLDLVGFVFRAGWAERNRAAVDGLLAAVRGAQAQLAASPEAWAAVRPLMDAPDDVLFDDLRRRFLAGTAEVPDAATEQRTAARLFELMLHAGGPRATGGLTSLPPGLFWQAGA